MRVRSSFPVVALVVLVALVASCATHATLAKPGLAGVEHILVIYAENRSFDHLYGLFPGANGLANATAEAKTQLDHDGSPLPYLTVFGGDGKPLPSVPRLSNEPFRIDAPPINLRLDQIGPSPIHAFYHNQE